MRNVLWVCLLAAGVGVAAGGLVAAGASGLHADAGPRGVLGVLKVGQPVAVDDLGNGFELQISTRKISTSYTVVEVGDDYVVLGNRPKLLELRIPVSSIKGIIHLKR